MGIWNIRGLLNRNGREVPFKTFEDLEIETKKRLQKIELDTTNTHIRIRNEVQDRKDEMTQKALKLFEKPTFINYVVRDLCGMIKKGTQYDGLSRFIEENIIDPLEKNGKIKILYHCQTSGWLIPVLQNIEFIDSQIEYPTVINRTQKQE